MKNRLKLITLTKEELVKLLNNVRFYSKFPIRDCSIITDVYHGKSMLDAGEDHNVSRATAERIVYEFVRYISEL